MNRIVLLLGICGLLCLRCSANIVSFPDYFRFGVSSSAHQIEGAWNSHGKGVNIWDHFSHTRSDAISDGSNADVACDSYHLYKRDVEMMAELGVDFYRFSIGWTRILPTGYINETNPAGIRYYNNLIDELLEHNITPIVTMHHWDHPQSIEDLGGFTNSAIVDYFADYAELLFQLFGDRVKEWTTFNEPWHTCFGYASKRNAPMKGGTGIADYLCGRNLLLAHAKVYHLYDEIYRPTQQGKVSICLDTSWYEPETESDNDFIASEKAIQFTLGWFAHPIYSKDGDYPPIMREIVDRNSIVQGFKRSRLPYFTKEEIEYMKGTSDYFYFNHYTTRVVSSSDNGQWDAPSHEDDYSYNGYQPEWFQSSGILIFKSVPWGFRKILNWIKNEYDNPVVVITENGYATNDEYPDEKRIEYILSYLTALHEAMAEDGCDIRGYSVWSLMDNYEWLDGYTGKFGLYEVDFNSPNKTRTIRNSGKYYTELIKSHTLA